MQKNIPEISITSSKSISNRLLILQFLFPELKINNLSSANDTKVLQKALDIIKKSNKSPINIDIEHSGTAMRFLTALLSIIEGKTFVLNGSDRMRQRPIKILVKALTNLGADIEYLQKDGFPPLLIKGKKLNKSKLKIDGNISSQYISALILIAPFLEKGLSLEIRKKTVSLPYIIMTINILKSIGIKTHWENNTISIKYNNNKINDTIFNVQGDWSSASYFYSLVSIMKKDIVLYPFEESCLQGDRKIALYFEKLGIQTKYLTNSRILLSPIKDFLLPDFLNINLIDTPDLAQTLAVVCMLHKMNCCLTGLQTLKIKETDRLKALKNELEKFGAVISITDDSLLIEGYKTIENKKITVKTYNDHRMALSFAVAQKVYPDVQINNPEIVEKSFPDFWKKYNI